MTEQKYYKVGKIVNTQGIKGEVRVMAETDFSDRRFAIGAKLYIDAKTEKIPVQIVSVRKQKNLWIVKFDAFSDINAVELYKGADLLVANDDRAADELNDDEYYYHDIIGLNIIDATTTEVYGPVKEILALGPNDVWVVDSPKYGEILIPFLKAIFKKIDIQAGTALVELPEGLIREN
ncbi:rimM protein [Agrilactobacillus composti DSM 18527 = JCM 14202]|uniref:Ribosome maturation factor RimM n=1 Tax=Agrilactobacillus composti DSM 18527 = JCM 14202 TaxID=1423734 RepID=X0PGQ1_9LACO|nr:ribosome maturation factor RimM [Agrilactobacillus composti]KRM36826.1 rimM protein [Agrilactobacillus composti DSM 18527 = JCM 14202]GAF41234.1 16S rRNA processing protein RimM [Agrilactobacillus composti DSM 18527 = JCM 14202]